MSLQLKLMKKMMQKQGASFGANLDVAALREAGKASAQMPPEKGVNFIPITLGGVEAELVQPQTMESNAVILYIHGGGFVSGSCKNFRAFTSYFAKLSKLAIYCVEYRLAPEYPFPAGPNDCFAAYKALLELAQGKKVFLLGESAGANLVFVTALRAKEQGLPLPTGIIAYAPLTDATNAVDHAPYTKTDIVLSAGAIEALKTLYCPQADATHPYISPYYGTFTSFPPVRLVWDNGEMLCPDNKRFCQRLVEFGVVLEAKEWVGTFHTFEILAKLLPESRQEINDSIRFIYKYSGALG